MTPAERDADLTVTDLERDAATQWRLTDGSESLTDYTSKSLRERLVEALAEIEPMREQAERVADAISSARDALNDTENIGGDRLKRSTADCAPEEWPERMADLVTSLAERIGDLQAEVETLRDNRDPGAVPVEPARAPKVKRSKLGTTTLALPFLLSSEAAANDGGEVAA